MVRLLFPFIVGILIGVSISVASLYLLFLLGGLLLALFILHLFHDFILLKASLFSAFFIVLGIFLVQKTEERYALPNDLDEHYVQAVIREVPLEKKQSIAVLIEVVKLRRNGQTENTQFRSMLYLPKDSTLLNWNYADTIVGKLQFRSLQENKNPYAFNYAHLLRQRQIYCTARGDLKTLALIPNRHFSIIAYSRKIQKKFKNILGRYVFEEKERGFLQAMTLGDKTSLSSEVRVDFADAGVVHVLAVSGLHVGILFLLVNLLLRPFKTTLRGRIFIAFVGICVIGAFAFISGLSVSVQRAAIMFTIIQISMISLRPYRIYNAIASSAVILLLINPFYLYEVGFQLSYLAVLSIVTFVPMWNKRKLQNRFLEQLKQLVLVSLAAQLGVAPLMLYYFHHLPTYFLLANIIVLFLAPFLLGGSLLILLFSIITIVAEALGFLISKLTHFCIESVNLIANLPYALLVDYTLDFYQMLLLYALILSVLFYVYRKSRFYLFATLCFLLSFIVYFELRDYRETTQELFVVHYARGNSCYSLLSGKKALVISEKKLDEEWQYIVEPLLDEKGIKEVQRIKPNETSAIAIRKSYYKSGYISKSGRQIVIFSEEKTRLKTPLSIDVLVLSKDCDWEEALRSYKAKQIVLDSSFSKKKSQKLTNELSALHYSVHNVATEGAFILD